jgi:hypothetical protein
MLNLKNSMPFLLVAIIPLLIFNACNKDEFKRTIWVKKGQSVKDIRASFSVEAPRAITHPAGVYRSGNLLFLLQENEGIGIMDITNPAAPVDKAFIKLLSNSHVVVKSNVLIADNGVDLVSIDISDLNQIRLVNRIQNVFSEKWLIKLDSSIFVGYEEQKISMFESYNPSDTIPPENRTTDNNAALAIGKGGSDTRFALNGNYLYIVRGNALTPVDLTQASNPVVKDPVGYTNQPDFETVYSYQGFLYVGTAEGVLILNNTISPATPYFVSFAARNVRGCDPVVVQNNFMFSTVRTGTLCTPFGRSSLFIHNVTDKTKPIIEVEQILEQPKGLGIDGNLLFVCQGDKGMAVYNWDESSKKLSYLYQKIDLYAFDVITGNNTLIVAADNGLYLYDYTDPKNIKKLSKIASYNF